MSDLTFFPGNGSLVGIINNLGYKGGTTFIRDIKRLITSDMLSRKYYIIAMNEKQYLALAKDVESIGFTLRSKSHNPVHSSKIYTFVLDGDKPSKMRKEETNV